MEALQPEGITFTKTSTYNITFLTEVLLESDPRYYSPKIHQTIKQEIEGLIGSKLFEFKNVKISAEC